MKKRNRILLAALIVVVIGGLVWVALREPPEPVYRGKKLSAWFQDALEEPTKLGYNRDGGISKVVEALDQTGTNALPFLLDMLKGKEYSPLRTKLVNWANQHNWIFHHHFWTEADRSWMEYHILYVLDSQRKTNLPVSGFLDILEESKNPWKKSEIVEFLPDLAANPETVRPAIVKALTDDNPKLRITATNALKRIDAVEARVAGVK